MILGIGPFQPLYLGNGTSYIESVAILLKALVKRNPTKKSHYNWMKNVMSKTVPINFWAVILGSSKIIYLSMYFSSSQFSRSQNLMALAITQKHYKTYFISKSNTYRIKLIQSVLLIYYRKYWVNKIHIGLCLTRYQFHYLLG